MISKYFDDNEQLVITNTFYNEISNMTQAKHTHSMSMDKHDQINIVF